MADRHRGVFARTMQEEIRRMDADIARHLRRMEEDLIFVPFSAGPGVYRRGHINPYPDAIEAEYTEHSKAPTPALPAKVGEEEFGSG